MSFEKDFELCLTEIVYCVNSVECTVGLISF